MEAANSRQADLRESESSNYTLLSRPRRDARPPSTRAPRLLFEAHRTGKNYTVSKEGFLFASAYEALIETLDRKRLIDRRRVGLIGFSREGYHAEYALTHSKFRFAAAIIADHWSPNYSQSSLAGWDFSSNEANGALPFGEGLKVWLKEAPAFNAEKITAPLSIELQSEGLLGFMSNWELYSRLRYLHRPIEKWVPPDYFHGAHNTQNPEQILAIQNYVVRWFDFWLNGHEDDLPRCKEQYLRWRAIRKEQLPG